jgi:tRNA G18 (ribose-2'-O)-methylase SpoU
MLRGYCGIGVQLPKFECNVGTLWRAADLFEAKFLFTVGRRYRRQASDTMKSWRHVPLYNFDTVADLVKNLPYSCQLVGVELTETARDLATFLHPERAIYLLGAEDHGLTKAALAACHMVIKLPGRVSMNVASAGGIVLYDRHVKANGVQRK